MSFMHDLVGLESEQNRQTDAFLVMFPFRSVSSQPKTATHSFYTFGMNSLESYDFTLTLLRKLLYSDYGSMVCGVIYREENAAYQYRSGHKK
eukprot:233345-Amphidinium_carterae.1